MADGEELFHPTATQSIWKVTRQLKKEQCSLYNCVASVLSDAAFVSEVRGLYPSLPLLANLRCGLWYTRQADGTCYFKSTDGHNGNWSFSSTRLNWNVCELAAKQGGVIIVDATRKGKRFPDAMTKTIPIWAAVVNRAVARKRAEAAARLAEAAAVAAAEPPPPELDTACDVDGTSHCPAPCGVPAAVAPRHPVQSDDNSNSAGGCCGGGAAAVLPPPGATHGAWAAWATTEGDIVGCGISSCTRVGSLSQWLQSPMAAAAREEDGEVRSPPLRPPPKLQRPLRDSRGADGPAAAAAAAAAAPSSFQCGAPAPDVGCEATDCAGEDAGAASTSCTAGLYGMYSLELQEEVSFNELGEMSPDGDQPPPRQLLPAADTSPSCNGPVAAAAEATNDGLCLYGAAQSTYSAAAAQTATGSQLLLSPFAKVAAAAAAATVGPPGLLEPLEAADMGSAAAARGGGTSVGAAASDARELDSVDLGAASASHVSCSPEEGWRWGGLFGGVVDGSGCNDVDSEPLRLCCNGNLHQQYSRPDQGHPFRHQGSSSRSGDEQLTLQPQSQPQGQQQWRRSRPQQESDPDADGSGGSCSDTCGPVGLSGRVSTRTSSSSSSSSSCVSRSNSCSSDHSDRTGPGGAAAGTLGGAAAPGGRSGGGGDGAACTAADPAPRLRPFPRHHTCSTGTPPPPWSPRRCGSMPPPLPPPPHAAAVVRGGTELHRRFSGAGSDSSGSYSRRTDSYASSSSSRYSSSGGGDAGGAAAVAADGAAPTGAAATSRAGGGCCAGSDCACADGRRECWDVGLHLPLWISSNERAQIERRLDGWVDALLRVGADVEGLAKVLRKPLRPLWISQSSTIWVDQVAQPDQLPFTPLYLVSASQPHSYLRQAACVGGDDADTDADGDGDADADADNSDGRRAAARRHHQYKRQGRGPQQQQQQQPHAWTYVYVPGAGDDEESWAAGLTPAVFWAHYPELLQAGPAGVQDAVRQVLQREATALAERGTNSSILAAAATHGTAASAYAAPTDQHHLLPAGCRGGAGAGSAGGASAPGPGGLFLIGPTGLALGDLSAGTAPGCWSHVDAVLSCGMQQHPSMAGEPQWPHGQKGEAAEAVATGPEAGLRQEPRQGQEHGAGVATAEGAQGPEGVDGEARSGGSEHHHHLHHHHHHHHQRQPPAAAPPRYLHLPVQHYKHNRTSLSQHLDAALDFLSYHLGRGHRVLIHDTNGLDTCVCVAVALLLACYGSCGGGGGGGGAEASAPSWVRPYRGGGGAEAELAPEAVSKDAVRQRLAYVSAFYPPGRPTRGMLRQVFNHFVNAKGGGGGGGGSGVGCEDDVE